MEGIDDNLENDKIILVKVDQIKFSVKILCPKHTVILIFSSVLRQGC